MAEAGAAHAPVTVPVAMMKGESARTTTSKRFPVRCAAAAFAALVAATAGFARAESPADIARAYAAEAARQQAGFAPSAGRGKTLYAARFTASKELPACATCHTDNPAADGRHQMTGKRITPLAPAANAERFSSTAKVEKWFKRNCTEVIGRECSAAEKADFITYMTTVRP